MAKKKRSDYYPNRAVGKLQGPRPSIFEAAQAGRESRESPAAKLLGPDIARKRKRKMNRFAISTIRK